MSLPTARTPSKTAPSTNTAAEPIPPVVIRLAHLLALSGAAAVALSTAIALFSGTATPGLIGWAIVAVAGLTFISTMARSGRRWGRAVLPVAAAASLGSTIPEAVPHQATGGSPLPLFLLLAGAVLAVAACALFFLAPAWFRGQDRKAQALAKRTRTVLLGVHVIVSLVWCGVICTTAVLAVTAALSPNTEIVAALTPAMVAIDETLLGPPALVALLSGVSLACGTRWGLLLHRWVAVKFWAIVAAVAAAPLLNKPALAGVEEALSSGASAAEVRGAAVTLALVYPVIPLVVLAVAVISYAKPWGRTRRGVRMTEGRGRRTAAAPMV